MEMMTTIVVLLIVYLAIIGIGIANYIMTSLSLYTIGKKRQVKCPWLAWIPIASNWAIGAIADEYDGQRGIERKWRVVLLTLSIIFMVTYIIFYVMYIVVIAILSVEYGAVDAVLAVFAVIAVIGMMFAMMAAITQQICSSICLYKIFESIAPEKSVKYLILSLLVPLAGAICLMKCKNRVIPKETPAAEPMLPEASAE